MCLYDTTKVGKENRFVKFYDFVTPDNLRQMQEYFGMKKIKTIEKYLQNTVEDLREELDRIFN